MDPNSYKPQKKRPRRHLSEEDRQKARRESCKQWRERNREKRRAYALVYHEVHDRPCKEEANRANRETFHRAKDELRDWYVRRMITNRTAIKGEDVPLELVDLKRAIIVLKRLLKGADHEGGS